jgi:hypothetical protein
MQRNFAVVVIAHAATDFLPNLLPWSRSFIFCDRTLFHGFHHNALFDTPHAGC